MAVFRGALPTDNFTIVSNDWARDPDLSYKAKGLLLAISSHKEGYRLSLQQLIAQGKDGRDAVKAGLRELVDAGYMRVIQNRGENGQMNEVDYVLTGKLSATDEDTAAPEGEESARSRQRRSRSAPEADFPSPVSEEQSRRSTPVADFPSPANPSTDSPSPEDPPLRRSTLKKTTKPKKTIHVTSTSAREVEAAADPVDDTRPSTKGLVEVNGNDALDQVDADELERTLLALPDRLRPTAGDATRLRDLITQRMRRGWSREDIVEVVDRRLRPGALDNPCGLFAKTLVPLDEAPPRRHLALAKPWCGECDEQTRWRLDDSGFPDPTRPKCGDCEQLLFTQHMARGAS